MQMLNKMIQLRIHQNLQKMNIDKILKNMNAANKTLKDYFQNPTDARKKTCALNEFITQSLESISMMKDALEKEPTLRAVQCSMQNNVLRGVQHLVRTKAINCTWQNNLSYHYFPPSSEWLSELSEVCEFLVVKEDLCEAERWLEEFQTFFHSVNPYNNEASVGLNYPTEAIIARLNYYVNAEDRIRAALNHLKNKRSRVQDTAAVLIYLNKQKRKKSFTTSGESKNKKQRRE